VIKGEHIVVSFGVKKKLRRLRHFEQFKRVTEKAAFSV